MALFEPVFAALAAADARYVVVGGLATVLHGFARLTADVDVVLDLEPAELEKTLGVFEKLEFRPRAPVALRAFADPETRRGWIEEKGMTVFSLWDPNRPMLELDLFAQSPLPFPELWARSEVVALTETSVRIAGIDDLIALKRLAGRTQDLQDIEALEAIREKRAR
jgi:hypothetical protein